MLNRDRGATGEDTGRIGGLSDGLFAIVLTLLVLQFQVPQIAPAQLEAELWPALMAQGSLLFSYVLSFVVVGLYWVVHHNLFKLINRYDRTLLYLNLLFLLALSFLPFPTELIGVHVTRLTWTIYAVNLAVVGLLMTTVWWYALSHKLVSDQFNARTGRLIILRGLTIPLVFLLSIGVSYASLPLAYWTPLLIVPLHVGWARLYNLSSNDF